MAKYDHRKIEEKWQKFWAKNKTFRTKNSSKKPKFYALDMFPYPSGAGLHVGHPVGYTATDIVSRKRRHEGFEVLHPMGWDAFGLPAENYAIKTGKPPAESTATNEKNFRRQLQMLGFSYDWEREFSTTDPKYFRWTQWLFLKMYRRNLLYEKKMPMNWCPKCRIVAANEEVENGLHERCGTAVERRNLKQWMFKITEYADRLLADLDAPNFVFVHGWGGTGRGGWIGEAVDFLEKSGLQVWAGDFPNSENPKYEEWEEFFEKNAVPKIGENTILIGHSLGAGFLQRYFSTHDLRASEIIFSAPTIGDCGISEISNFFTGKKRRFCSPETSRGGCSNGNLAENSPFSTGSILPDKIPEVKKKNNFGIPLNEMKKSIFVPKKGEIIFDGRSLARHFSKKEKLESHFRRQFRMTVMKSISKLFFNSENVGYFRVKNIVFRVVLREISEKKFVVKTFYRCQNFSREFEVFFGSKFKFDYQKIADSVGRIRIFGSDDDEYIRKSEFEFLAEKLGAEFIFLPNRGHLSESLPHFPEMLEILKNFRDSVLDWPEKVKLMQKNWIGRSEGAEVDFEVCGCDGKKITVFTTRPDTLFGATFMVISPENPLVEQITTAENREKVKKYQKSCSKKSELERTELNREKTGVFTGGFAKNPVSGKKIPIWIADYILMSYGTGAVMAVPAHDERDFEFAKRYNLEIVEVIDNLENPFQKTGGILKNSGFLNGLDIERGIQKMIDFIESEKIGIRTKNYKLRDWIFTRQRYWGEPIPLIHCKKCGVAPVPEADLPILLPKTDNFLPTEDGESPLAKISSWVRCACPKCGGAGQRETSTMPNWAGSNWYWLRFMDPGNSEAFCSREAEKKWGPVDLYVGGAEHAVLHLLYSRFWHKVLYDAGLVSTREPFKKLVNTGLILAEDGVKMSKSLGNVVNPDEMVKKFGADSLRMFLMFVAPFEQTKSWNEKSLAGVRKFLDRVWRFFDETEFFECEGGCPAGIGELRKIFHRTIKIVSEHIDEFRFNTAISQMMIFLNSAQKFDRLPKKMAEKFAILLSPFAPHLAEEFWQKLGHEKSIAFEKWPEFDPKLLVDDTVRYAVQVNGRVRADFEISREADREAVLKHARGLEKVAKYLAEGEVKKEIFVPGKICGFVVSGK